MRLWREGAAAILKLTDNIDSEDKSWLGSAHAVGTGFDQPTRTPPPGVSPTHDFFVFMTECTFLEEFLGSHHPGPGFVRVYVTKSTLYSKKNRGRSLSLTVTLSAA